MNAEDLFWQPCKSPFDLRHWLELFLGLKMPMHGVCPNHVSPFEYVCRAYFEPSTDVIIWGPRGGGKTRLGAAVTLLDMVHKPGTQIRILGGSLEQSLKMWHHLQDDIQGLIPQHVLKGRGRTIRLDNGSSAAVLTQSQKAVRGLRVQKLRCDEVELFDERVWTAAQLVTKSKDAGGRMKDEKNPESHSGFSSVSGVVEAMSTFHRPWGLMSKIVKEAEERGKTVLKWCLMEVLEKCAPERDCKTCPLWEDCAGRAKNECTGFLKIDDAIAMKKRVSTETWQAEMLCRGVKVEGAVFGAFDVGVHVGERKGETATGRMGETERGRMGERATGGVGEVNSGASALSRAAVGSDLWLGIDFGYANPFVCLWIFASEGAVFVVDEYVKSERTVDEHLRQIDQRPWGKPAHVACDPAGGGRNEQTANSNVDLLRQAGFRVHARGSRIVDGVEKIRQYLRNGSGVARLHIHPRCERLIRAMQGYRYAGAGSELPVKDGEHDHLIDALRYFFVNWQTAGKIKGRMY